MLKQIAMTFLHFSYYLHIMSHSVRLLIHTREFVIENVYKLNLVEHVDFYIQHEISLWIVSFDVFEHSGCINDDLCIQYTVVYRPDVETHEHHVLVLRNISKVTRVCVCVFRCCVRVDVEKYDSRYAATRAKNRVNGSQRVEKREKNPLRHQQKINVSPRAKAVYTPAAVFVR